MIERLKAYAPQMHSILRIVIALLFLEHGTQKLFGFPAGDHPMSINLLSLMGAAGIIELVGGTLLVLGLFTRCAAFICAGETAYIFWVMDVPRGGIFPAVNGGEDAVAYCFVFLFLLFAGPGPWSVDAALGRES